MRRFGLAGVVAVALVIVAAAPLEAGSLTSEADGLRVEFASRPGRPVATRQTEYVVRLTDRVDQPVDGARLTLRGIMADGMASSRRSDLPGRPACTGVQCSSRWRGDGS